MIKYCKANKGRTSKHVLIHAHMPANDHTEKEFQEQSNQLEELINNEKQTI